MNVNPGEFRQTIHFVKTFNGTNENGYPVKTRETVYTCKAKFSRISGTELIKSNAEFTSVKVRFLIRYTPLVDRKYIIEYAENDYEIEYINDYEDKHRYIEIIASRKTV
jgi:SPP1 family predicted phage head-tail adaptor